MFANTQPMTAGLISGSVNVIEPMRDILTGPKDQDKKTAIDDIICHYLDGQKLKNALSFIDYIRASKMKIKWSAANTWSVIYKHKRVMDIKVREDFWGVRLVYDHMTVNYVFTKNEAENIKNLIGQLRNSMPERIEPIPVMS